MTPEELDQIEREAYQYVTYDYVDGVNTLDTTPPEVADTLALVAEVRRLRAVIDRLTEDTADSEDTADEPEK